jgi:fumarate reductase subunit D
MPSSFFNDNNDNVENKPLEGTPVPEVTPTATHGFKTDEGRLAAVMSYIPFLCFVPLLNMRHNPEAIFHARQGLMLFLIELVAFLFLFDRISTFVFTAILIVAVALSMVGIFFALQGRNYRLPIVGDLADKSKL